jgi:hypothetical protein
MSSWFTVHLKVGVGSLAAVTAALAGAGIAIEGIVGSPESEDGVVHLAVAEAALDRAVVAVKSTGAAVASMTDEVTAEGAQTSSADGMIGAILNGPRT